LDILYLLQASIFSRFELIIIKSKNGAIGNKKKRGILIRTGGFER